jgi:lipid A ethanolaminephosphotransferase
LGLNVGLVAVGFAPSFASLYPYYGDMSSFVRNNNKKLSRSLLPTAPVYALYKNLVSKGKEQYIEKQIVDVDAKIKSTQIRHPRKPLAVVVIIGETARASSFILDDAEKLGNKNNLIDEDNLVYFSNFWSCGTNTALSVPCMFSFFTKDDYKREYNKQNENVAELLQRVGYSVTWKENDGGCKGICKTLNNQSIDTEQSQQYSHGNEYYDEALVFDLAEQIHKKVVTRLYSYTKQAVMDPHILRGFQRSLKNFNRTVNLQISEIVLIKRFKMLITIRFCILNL